MVATLFQFNPYGRAVNLPTNSRANPATAFNRAVVTRASSTSAVPKFDLWGRAPTKIPSRSFVAWISTYLHKSEHFDLSPVG
jgi:hypothetical protein